MASWPITNLFCEQIANNDGEFLLSNDSFEDYFVTKPTNDYLKIYFEKIKTSTNDATLTTPRPYLLEVDKKPTNKRGKMFDTRAPKFDIRTHAKQTMDKIMRYIS